MFGKNRFVCVSLASLLALSLLSGCGGGGAEGAVLVVDAEFDPAAVSNLSSPIGETTTSAAQIFDVIQAGKLEEFWIVLTNAESADEGTVQVTIRPLDGGGRPNPSSATSIIAPIDVDTTTLAAFPIETFVEFDVGDDPGRVVDPGNQFAIVVEFVNRVPPAGAVSDGLPIARLLGRDDNGDPIGMGSTSPDGVTWTNNAPDDYIYRTFVLQP